MNPFGRSFPIQKRVWILFKNQFVSKMICKQFIKQNACENVLFNKILSSSSFQKCCFEKVLGKPNLFAKGLPFKKRNDFKSISKLVLFTSNKKGAMFCFENRKQVSKPFDLNSFLKMLCFTRQRFFKKTLDSKTCLKGPTPTWNIIMMINLLISTLSTVRSLWVWDLKWHSSCSN